MDGLHRSGAQRVPRWSGNDALDPTTESLCDGYDQQEREGADGNTSHSSPCVKCEWVRADVTDLPYNTGRLVTSPIQIGNRGENIFLSGCTAGSETQLQGELNDTGVRRADDLAETCADGHARNAEVGMVKGVEELRPELRRDPLAEGNVLGEIEIQVHHSRSPHHAHSRVAVDLVRHETRPRHSPENSECVGVKPTVDATLVVRQSSIGNPVRTAAALSSQT